MLEPKQYERDELLSLLQKNGPALIERLFLPEQDLYLLVKESVGRNTFRAFHKLSQPPSVVFREWAASRLSPELFTSLAECTDQADFDHTHDELAESLASFWLSEGKKPLTVGPGRKLLDLLFKTAIRWSLISSQHRAKLIRLLNVPLDSYSLAAVRKIASTGEFCPAIEIPSKTSMTFVKSIEQYYGLQRLMRGIATVATVPPICIDLLAWNVAHEV